MVSLKYCLTHVVGRVTKNQYQLCVCEILTCLNQCHDFWQPDLENSNAWINSSASNAHSFASTTSTTNISCSSLCGHVAQKTCINIFIDSARKNDLASNCYTSSEAGLPVCSKNTDLCSPSKSFIFDY